MPVEAVLIVVCMVAFVLLLTFSKLARAVVYESVRHPLTVSRIQFRNGKVMVARSSPGHPIDPPAR